MEILLFVLALGAIWVGYKAGLETGRNTLIEKQSSAIAFALSTEGDFYRATGLHGSFLLEGHENTSPTDFVLVRYSELKQKLKPSVEDLETEFDGSMEGTIEATPETNDHSQARYSPSPQLAEIVGQTSLTRTEATKLVWGYVERNGLRDPKFPARVHCDPILRAVTGQDDCSMFSLAKLVGNHLR